MLLMHSPAFFQEALGKLRQDRVHKFSGEAHCFLCLLYVGLVGGTRIPKAHSVFGQHCDARDSRSKSGIEADAGFASGDGTVSTSAAASRSSFVRRSHSLVLDNRMESACPIE
jgi:hypothetical protein